MNSVSPLALEQCVVDFCKYLLRQGHEQSWATAPTEASLWKRATTAVLSSQVGYEIACAYSDVLTVKRLLPPASDTSLSYDHESHILEALTQPVTIKSHQRRYRFPKLRARQLATTAKRFQESNSTLTGLFTSEKCPKNLRGRLVESIDGMGAKQASMFIRDTGRSDELAIIDRHILDYMTYVGLADPVTSKQVSSSKYLKLEKELENYAKFLQLPLGKLDWSIWIVMRVVKKEELN